MKNGIISGVLFLLIFQIQAQSTRVSLYESFCGETCPPCAATNPMIHNLLSSTVNTALIVGISWETPIPSAPTNTWSLYQTNKIEHDWRWKPSSSAGYGYGINFVPNGRLDGQNPTLFGANSDNSANMNNTVIATAQSYTTPFSINIIKVWDATYSSINAFVQITSASNFTAAGNLTFRLVMIEREVHFATPSGTNGEKDFYNSVVKSFPSLQSGTSMSGTWTAGQTQSFILNCVVPSYVRDKSEIALVGFIQDDGNRKVWQTKLSEEEKLPYDVKAISLNAPKVICKSQITCTVSVKNNGSLPVDSLIIAPSIDGSTFSPVSYYAGMAPNDTGKFVLNFTAPTFSSGIHTLNCEVKVINGTDFNTSNNNANVLFANNTSAYSGIPIVEGFSGTFPPSGWTILSSQNSYSWVKYIGAGGFQQSSECVRMNMYNIPSGNVSEMYMRDVDLRGANIPVLSFDVAYCPYFGSSSDNLIIQVSADCGETWISVYNKSGLVLNTNPYQCSSNWVPSTASDWRHEILPLAGFDLKSVLVKFTGISGNGNNVYLDNINLIQTNPLSVSEHSGSSGSTLSIFPNPGQSEMFIRTEVSEECDATLNVLNELGQYLLKQKLSLHSGPNEIQLDVSQFTNGLYQVMVETPMGSSVKKCAVNH